MFIKFNHQQDKSKETANVSQTKINEYKKTSKMILENEQNPPAVHTSVFAKKPKLPSKTRQIEVKIEDDSTNRKKSNLSTILNADL